ncbi:hypothetical protein AB832_06805 [Flavobacteriaceae bacterium (ex Bugula neritina AB1)]|nr:hypothetical protein AB832_06805 [Flavobacteriaceae bacterium (ex Bugula neritina AB1)]
MENILRENPNLTAFVIGMVFFLTVLLFYRLRRKSESEEPIDIGTLERSHELQLSEKKLTVIQRFFLFLSGTDPEVIRYCPRREIYLQSIIGVSILLTAIFAFISGSYGFYKIFESPVVSIIAGIFWGLTIMNIDRQLVASFKVSKGASLDKQIMTGFLAPLFFRVPLAVFLGFVISIPLELRLLESEIQDSYNSYNLAIIDSLESARKVRIDQLENELNDLGTKRNQDINDAYTELKRDLNTFKGDKRSLIRKQGIEGFSTAIEIVEGDTIEKLVRNKRYFDYQDQIENLSSNIEETEDRLREYRKSKFDLNIYKDTNVVYRVELIESEIASINKSYNEKISQRRRKNSASFADSYYMMTTVFNKSPAYKEIGWGIRFLIVLVEIIPVLMKLLTPTGHYSRLLDHFEAEEEKKYGKGTVR